MWRSADGGRGPARASRLLLLLTGWLLGVASLARAGRQGLTGLALPGTAGAGEQMQDFRDALYYPVRELFRPGGMPYDPAAMFAHWPVQQEFDLYLPAHLLLHAPLAAPPYRVAALIMVVLNSALVAGLAVCAVRWAGLSAWAAGFLVAFLGLGQVGKAQIYLGQINPVVGLGVAGALALRDRPRAAALCLALAWFKPQYGLPLTLLLLASGRWRTAVTGTLTALVASLPVVAVLVARAGGPGGFVDVLRRNVAYATSTAYGAAGSPTSHRVDLTALFSRATATTPPDVAEPVVFLAVLAVAAWVLRRSAAAADPGARALAAVVAALAVVLCAVHQSGDVLGTVPAAAALAVAAAAAWRSGAKGWALAAAGVVVLLAVPHVHVTAVDDALRAALGDRAAGVVDGVALLTAFGLGVALLLRQRSVDDGPVLDA